MAQEVLGLPDAGLVAAVTTAVSNGDAKAGLESAAELLESGCPVEQALEFFAARWRDFLVLRTCGKETDLVDLSPEAKLIAASQAQNFEPHELVHFVAVCEAAIRAIRSSGSSRTIFDATIARLCLHREFVRIEIAASHSTLTGEAEKKNVSSSPRPATLISAAFKRQLFKLQLFKRQLFKRPASRIQTRHIHPRLRRDSMQRTYMT